MNSSTLASMRIAHKRLRVAPMPAPCEVNRERPNWGGASSTMAIKCPQAPQTGCWIPR